MGLADDIGKGVGGLFRNPGILALGALAIGLFIFRKPIQEAFGNLSGQIGNLFSPSGIISGAGQEAGQFVFNIGQDVGGAVFDAGAGAGQAVFDAGKDFGDFLGGAQNQIDQALSNFFKVKSSEFDIFTSNLGKDFQETTRTVTEEGGPLTQGFDFLTNLFGQGNVPPEFQSRETLPVEFIGPPREGQSQFDPFSLDPDRPLSLFDFANRFNIQPSEAFSIQKQFGGLDFEAIAAIPTFGEVLQENPELTASQIANLKFIQAGGGEGFDFGTNTGMALELAQANFGSSTFLKREDPNFDLLLQAEALRSQATLGGGGGDLFGNPDFPITLGEAFLGESGTVVSQSISNLSQDELKDFIERFG